MICQKSSKIALLLMTISTFSISQTTDLITNIQARNLQSLNGNWQIIIDPYEDGYYDYRYVPKDWGFFRNQKPRSKSDLIEYDFDKSETLRVPGDWNSQMEKLFFYEGTVWYKRDFTYTKKSGKRLFVHFGAVNYQAIVFLNGEKIGEHVGGFTPFNIEITNQVNDGNNFLILKVDNQRHRAAVPTVITDWWNYGGITRDVNLIETSGTFVQDYTIQLDKDAPDQIAGCLQLDGTELKQKITISIPEVNFKKSIHTDENGFAAFEWKVRLERWSPENPKLYRVIINSAYETVVDTIGFRTITTRGADILLNGEPIFLRGICIHEQAPGRDGRATSRSDAATLLGWAEELHCNFVRLAHYPHNEYMLRLADKMGILIWSEIPVYWTIQWENPATLENAKQQLTEMITRDKNRAAVILWSMSNETPLSQPRLNFLIELVKTTRQLDNTRLITAALERHYTDAKTLLIDDPFGEYLDVIGVNEYIGWYDGLPAKADTLIWQSIYKKPLIMSEFGGGAKQGIHGDELTRWTEEYQANLYEHQLNMLRRITFLRGTTPWILTDFRSPRRPLPEIQDYWNRKGLISDQGIKKQAFFILQQFYHDMKSRK